MTKTKRLGRFLILLLAMVMVLGVFIASPASAKDYSRTKTTLYVTVKVADIKYAGTDSNIYFKAYLVKGKEFKVHLDSKADDFERNSKRTYEVTVEHPYWYIKGFGFQNGGNDAMCIDEIWIEVNDKGNSAMQRVNRTPRTKWIEKSEWSFDIDQNDKNERSYRQVQPDSGAYDTFTKSFEKTVYLGESGASGSKVEVKWKDGYPVVDDDGVYTEWYNPNKYELAPKLTILPAYADNVTGNWVENDNGFNKRFTLITDDDHKDWGPIGFSYDADSLMKNTPYFAYRVKVTWEFPKEGSSSSHSKSVYYYIYRKQFEMGDPTVVSKPDPYPVYVEGHLSNKYFNAGNTTVDFRIPVVAHNNYSSSDVAQKLAKQSGVKALLYYGKGSGDYLTGTISYKSGDKDAVYVSFPFSKKVNDSESVKLVLTGLNVPMGGVTYSLNWKQSYEQGAAKELTIAGDKITLGDGAYFVEDNRVSVYKLDNVEPAVELNEKGAAGLTGAWQQRATLVTVPDDLYLYPLVENPVEGLFLMELLDAKGNPIKFSVVNEATQKASSAAASVRVPTKVGRETTVTVPKGEEYANLTVRITCRDRAGNKMKEEFSGLNLDMKAPVVTVSSETRPQAADGSRSILYRFRITEISNTGRVNYCFVPAGQDPPSETEGKQTSGTIDSFINQWAYISQQDIGGATVVLKLEKGESFDGYLCYYAVDDAGNETDKVKESVSISNQAAGCTVTVEDYDHPLPEYRISFTPEKDCVVYYRYATPTANGEYFRRPYVAYDPKVNPGSVRMAQVAGAADVASALNGQQILEYKVVNEKSGNVAYFEGGLGIPLVFDNTAPELYIQQTTAGLSAAAHSFILTASDISGIASASYEITTADGKTDVASGSLEIAEGSDSLYAFLGTTELGLGCGSYVLTVYAADRNGTEVAASSEVFSIRNAPPEAEMTLNEAEPADVNIVGASMTYTLELNVTEKFEGATDGHSVYWRVSSDGAVYSDWKKLSDLTPGKGVLTAEAVLDTPMALSEGLNMVFVQLVCAENEKTLLRGVSGDSILTLDPLRMQLDVAAPIARWSFTCGRNNEAVTGTLEVFDDVTANPAVSCDTDGVTLEVSETNASTWLVTYEPGSTLPDSFTLAVADEAGNETAVEVTTELLDLAGPTIDISTPDYTSYGDRTDAAVTVTVTEEHPGQVDFQFDETAKGNALVVEDETNPGVYTVYLRGYTGSMPFTVVAADDLGNETTKKSGNIEVKCPAITMEIAAQPAYAQDSATVVLRFNVPAVAAMTEKAVEALAEEALKRGTMDLTASCVLELTAEEYAAIKDEGGMMEFNVWAEDAFGNTERFTIQPRTIFGKEYPINVSYMQDGVEIKGEPEYLVAGKHIADPSDGSDSSHTFTAGFMVRQYHCYNRKTNEYFTIEDDPDEDWILHFYGDKGTHYIRSYSEETDGYFYDESRNLLPNDEVSDEDFIDLDYCSVMPYTYLNPGDPRIGEPIEFYDEESAYWHGAVVCTKIVPVGPILLESGETEDGEAYYEYYYASPEDYDDKNSLFFLASPEAYGYGGIQLQSSDYGDDSDIDPLYFATHMLEGEGIIFDVENSGTVAENVSSARLNISMCGYDKTIGYENEKETSDVVYIRDAIYSVEDDTLVLVATPYSVWNCDIWMNRTLTFNFPIITVAPAIDYTAIQNTLAPEMIFQATAAGHGADMKTFKLLYSTDNGSSWNAVDAWTAADDGIPALSLIVKLTDSGTYELVKRTITPAADNADNDFVSDTNLLGDGVTLPADTKFCLYAENIYGLSTLTDKFTVTVHDSPLSASDFTVTIAPDGGAAQTAVLDENGEYRISETFANFAVAKLIPTADGEDRGLTAVNSPSMEAVLTPEQNFFTFRLTDDFGYTFEVSVRYESFDLTPPALEYTLPSVGKTNQPYDVTVTASDGESGIGEVLLTLNGSGGGPIDLTDNGDGTWTGTIERSGSYIITAVDKMGNRSLRSFTVTNIDTAKPKLVRIDRNIDVWTQESVVTTLYFDKPNVTIVSAEAAQDDSVFRLDKTARTLTFKANGTVTVTFRDDYGNVEMADVSVTNIYDEPPKLAPVVTPANDKLSVQVSFVKAKDSNGAAIDIFHDLKELTVIHNGVAYAARSVVKDEKGQAVVDKNGDPVEQDAVFLLRENGTYTFTVLDKAGLMQFIKLTLTGIDRSAPKVTAVSWSYTYLDDSGNEKNAAFDLDKLEGRGYRIGIDLYPRTNRDVSVVVTTDKPTAITGSYEDYQAQLYGKDRDNADVWGKERSLDYESDDAYAFDLDTVVGKEGLEEFWTTDHELIYRANGLYIFNLEKETGLSDHYGVDVEIIDKTEPVLTLENAIYLMYVEGRDTGSIREALMDYKAWDVYLGTTTDLTGKVQVDFGGLDVDVLENNTFDKSKPFTVTYSVKDDAGNETVLKRTVVLVGINDVLVTVNGVLPDSNMMAESRTGTVELKLINFSGAAFATYAPTLQTFGQMKTRGAILTQNGVTFKVEGLAEGWYTFFIQTETRDYFNIYVFVG